MLLHSVFSMEKCGNFEEDCENINMCKVHKNGSETDAYEKTNEMCEFEKEEKNCRKSAKWTHKICRKSSKREQKGKNVKEMRKIRGKRFAQTKGSISRRCGGND